ncbi:protein toll-like [Amphibalanus amphitrite]|uniref:protein toll-like n=1 Tax=Amphibalanus amphitrite TaxID=1232801 RepID=UPI001C8FC915|nr:protein toll-like [Amphibalanus amphitrite]
MVAPRSAVLAALLVLLVAVGAAPQAGDGLEEVVVEDGAGSVRAAESEIAYTAEARDERASSTSEIVKPQCDRQDACFCEAMPAGSFKLFCTHPLDFTFRFTYVAPTELSPASIVIWCDPLRMRREHYDHLFTYGMRLGAVHTVVFNLCLLPAGPLADFLGRLGVTGLQRLTVASHAILNDTIEGDFLDGVNATTVQLTEVSRIQLHDHFLASLGQLESLTMTGGALQLPGALFRHTPRLGRLGLTDNRLHSLPEGLFDGLTQLTQLGLGKNRLRQLTRRHFRDLGRLEWLDLYVNELETLPVDVFAPLHSLHTLRMEDNPLRTLPDGLFAGTPELRKLLMNGGTLRGGQLRRLPAGVFRGLAKLDMLMLHQLGLEELPATLFANLTSLANLTLDRNRLETLPDTVFADLSNLRNLDLHGNRLRRVPARLLQGLGQLDTLYLDRNGLAALPDDLFTSTPHLERLFLRHNNLTLLTPRAFAGLRTGLRLLQLDHNQLVLDGTTFKEMPQLQELHLANNRIDRITDDVIINLMQLRLLDLRNNQLKNITFNDLNFLCTDARIDLSFNQITTVSLEPFGVVQAAVMSNDRRRPNTIVLRGNPVLCDCHLVSLWNYLAGTGPLAAHRDKLDELFRLDVDGLQCAGPDRLAGQPLTGVPSADQLLCPLIDDCPAGCQCSEQRSERLVLVTCAALPAGAPLPTVLPHIAGYNVSLHLEGAGLRRLTDLSNTSAVISELHLSRNNLTSVPVTYLPPSLRLLRLDHNNLTNVSEPLLGHLQQAGARVWLGNNPYRCDCDLLPLHRFVLLSANNGSGSVQDVSAVRCDDSANRTLLEMKPDEVCPSRLAMVIAACVAATALAMCALVAAVIYYNYRDTIKVWLYAHGLCMALVSEEELDTDKKYDAFVSYSHLDEEFVVEQLVPELERGDPKYTLCLHFRDWLAGEFIADQIQDSVQDSRRVIVVLSKNFIQSDWGRMEFLTAHKQALSERRNRVILVVYGELPEPSAMDPELRSYISLNTYLQWGDPLFWQRLRYALPHKGRRMKKSARRRRLTSDKLGLILSAGGLSSAGSTPAVTPTVEMPATPPDGHLNGCFVGDKLPTISESRLREQRAADNAV